MENIIATVLKEHNVPYALKAEQVQIIEAVARNKNVFGLLPTGFGKSDCYGWLSSVMDKINPNVKHTTLVISPLRSLMIDQVNRWTALGVKCAAILRSEEMEDCVKDGISKGEYEIVFASPEAIFRQPWRSKVKQWQDRLTALVVDEVHCMTKWSTFREEYAKVYEVQSILSGHPTVCLTATATQEMLEEIIKMLKLEMSSFEVVAVLPDRPNIKLEMYDIPDNKLEEHLAWYCTLLKKGKEAPKAIIYARQLNEVARIYGWLMTSLGEKAWVGPTHNVHNRVIDMYHGSTDVDSQKHVTSSFCQKTSPLRCVVATMAFGLGIQAADVDYVIHWGPAKDVLGYWQEVGRCARDGRQGYGKLYIFPRSLNKRYVDGSMIQLCRTTSAGKCMRQAVLNHLRTSGMKESVKTVGSKCCSACAEEK